MPPTLDLDLDRFPRAHFAHLPTPLERLSRLAAALGGAELWIKRDDCTGLATGGNKTRKLEFLLGEALEQGADTVITFGALQSNHARQTAAAAARQGLACHLVLVRLVDRTDADYTGSANLLLDDLLGAEVHVADPGPASAVKLREITETLEREGRRAYVIPPGGSTAIGALGYVDCAAELAAQANAFGLEPETVVLATSSAGTQAGLVVGLDALGASAQVLGVNVFEDAPHAIENVLATLCAETAAKLGVPPPPAARLRLTHEFLGAGYGVPTDAMLEAVRLVAENEGILLDPVYSGKAMAGLIAMLRRGELRRDERIVFVHTGGTASLPAYREALAR